MTVSLMYSRVCMYCEKKVIYGVGVKCEGSPGVTFLCMTCLPRLIVSLTLTPPLTDSPLLKPIGTMTDIPGGSITLTRWCGVVVENVHTMQDCAEHAAILRDKYGMDSTTAISLVREVYQKSTHSPGVKTTKTES